MNAKQCHNATHSKIWRVLLFDEDDPRIGHYRAEVIRHALSMLISPRTDDQRLMAQVSDPAGDEIRARGRRIIVIAHCAGCVFSFLTKVHPDEGYMIDSVLIPPDRLA